MKKLIRTMLNILFKILSGIMLFFVIAYLGLWIYGTIYVSNDFKEYYKDYEIMDLTENQYKIIWYALTGNNDYKFRWSPFLFDIIYYLITENDNFGSIEFYTSEVIINNSGYSGLNNAHPRYYLLYRFINYDNDWKRCISILMNNWYFGNNLRTLEEATKYYYDKDLSNISERELASLLLIKFPNYEINDLMNENIDRILDSIY